jgi:hypothetical protein
VDSFYVEIAMLVGFFIFKVNSNGVFTILRVLRNTIIIRDFVNMLL